MFVGVNAAEPEKRGKEVAGKALLATSSGFKPFRRTDILIVAEQTYATILRRPLYDFVLGCKSSKLRYPGYCTSVAALLPVKVELCGLCAVFVALD
jgi:hypothetical protein